MTQARAELEHIMVLMIRVFSRINLAKLEVHDGDTDDLPQNQIVPFSPNWRAFLDLQHAQFKFYLHAPRVSGNWVRCIDKNSAEIDLAMRVQFPKSIMTVFESCADNAVFENLEFELAGRIRLYPCARAFERYMIDLDEAVTSFEFDAVTDSWLRQNYCTITTQLAPQIQWLVFSMSLLKYQEEDLGYLGRYGADLLKVLDYAMANPGFATPHLLFLCEIANCLKPAINLIEDHRFDLSKSS